MISNRMDGLSMNIEQTNLDKLRSVFPECVSEGKLDIDKLLSLCGEYIDNDFEKTALSGKARPNACGWPRSVPAAPFVPALLRVSTGTPPRISTSRVTTWRF